MGDLTDEAKTLAEFVHAKSGAPMSVCARWAAETLCMVAFEGGRSAPIVRVSALKLLAQAVGIVGPKTDGAVEEPIDTSTLTEAERAQLGALTNKVLRRADSA